MITATDVDLMSATVEKTLNAFLEARSGARRFHAEAIGEDVDPHGPCWGDLLARLKALDYSGLEKHYGRPEVEKSALNESTGATGGWLVPVEMSTKLYEQVAEQSIIRQFAPSVPMKRRTMLCPVPDVVTQYAQDVPPFFGGMKFAWAADGATRAETEPGWRQVELTAWDLSAYCLASNDWLADAARGTEKFFRTLIASAVAWAEDYAFLRGDGVGKPLGFLNSPAALSVTRKTASHYSMEDGLAMVKKLLPYSWSGAIFVMHPLVIEDMMNGPNTYFQPNQPVTDPASVGGKKAAPVGSLYYHQVFVSEKLPPLGTPGDVILVDPRLYVIGDRRELVVDVSADEPTAFLKNQSVVRVLARVAGAPWLGGPVRLSDGSTTVSPYVYLT